MTEKDDIGVPSSGSQVPIDDSNFSFSLSRLHPSDSGYGDSPGSTNASSLRFAYDARTRTGGDDEVAFGLDDIVIDDEHDMMDDDDDDVFMETTQQLQNEDLYDGIGDSDDDNRDRHPSENSPPIDIPLSIQLTNTSGAIAMGTPPRFYNSQMHSRIDDSPSASSLVMSGALHSPGRWSVMATRFNSPADSLRTLWQTAVTAPSTTVSQSHPERRPRFFSEGCALGDNGETVVEEEPAVGPLTRRDRSRSEPAIQRELHRAFGRELRRISDEFHQSYQTLHAIGRQMEGRNGAANGAQASSSYPGSYRSRRNSWWQRVIQFMSPPVLDTVHSPDVSPSHDDDNSSSPFSSSQSSTQTVRTPQRPASEVDDTDASLDDVDGQVPQPDAGVVFQIGDMEQDTDSSDADH